MRKAFVRVMSALFVLVAIACSDDDGDRSQVLTTRKPASAASSATTGTSGDATGDVTITSCGIGESGGVLVKGTIVNSGSELASYNIAVVFLDSSGTQIDDRVEPVLGVDPGRTAAWEISAAGVRYQQGVVCKLAHVERATE